MKCLNLYIVISRNNNIKMIKFLIYAIISYNKIKFSLNLAHIILLNDEVDTYT